jgi:drug/metabolite transporter (DMT)-like permease
MPPDISDGEAELALSSIEHRRRQVIAEIDMPPWYWWGLAAGWIGLGILADFDHPWLTLVVTLCFGAAHAWVASHVLSGRHRSRQLSVRADVVDPHIPALVIGFLLLMVAITVVLALVANADGARHPSIMASVVVAVVVLLCGPALMAAVRRRLEHRVVA